MSSFTHNARAAMGSLSWLLLLSSADVEAQAQQQDESRFRLFGLGDITYVTGDSVTDSDVLFSQLVAHSSLTITDRFTLFGEMSLSGRDSEFEFDVERLFAKYDFSDQFKLSVGKFNTPTGYWNTAFHRGNWLQTSSGRPTNSRLTPSQMVGLRLQGNLPGETLGLSYEFAAGEGRHEIVAQPGSNDEVDGDRAMGISLSSRPESISDLSVGVSYYKDRFMPAASLEMDEEIFSVYAAWESESPEVIVEYKNIRNSPVRAPLPSNDLDILNFQLAYRLPGRWDKFKPYIRVEDIDVELANPMLIGSGNSYRAEFAGLRYDMTSQIALKFEYHRERFGDRETTNNYLFQFSMYLGGNR